MRPLAVLLLALLCAAGAPAQETPPEPPEPAPVGAGELLQSTLGKDIDSAGYYELLAWCREQGLPDTGSSQALRERLYAFYGLEAAAEGAKEAPQRVLSIQSARTTESFTVEPVGEDLILLQGDVVVELQEGEAVHRIRAQKILLNQSADLLTAEGNLEYVYRKGDTEDVFRGQRLTFNVDTWEGAFFSGGVEGDREVSGKKIRFYFTAESISKMQGSTVLMDRGVITSCDAVPAPHYHIRARKIWVLAPGEWAISSAVLYIGRVPVLYLPFFFRPGDEFFFHPALGYKDREGNFLQTTTYLIGQKARTPSAISVLSATEPKGAQAPREIQGLFLRPVEGEAKPPVPENRFLKVFLDIYSRLGGFAGVSGDFPPKVSFRSGLGITRNIYERYIPSYGYVYTPWKESGSYESVWNRTWLSGMQLPFRYGLDGKWNLAAGSTRISGKFEFYSDPAFARDFYNRSEESSLTRLLSMQSEGITTAAEGLKSGLGWELNTQMEFPKLAAGTVLRKLSVPYLNSSLYWQKSARPRTDLDPSDVDADPTAYFFYPVSWKLPNAALQVSGDLISRSSGSAAAASPGPAPARDLRFPAQAPAALPAPSPAGQTGEQPAVGEPPAAGAWLRRPAARENLPVPPALTPVSFNLSYQARPAVAVEQSFNTESWEKPSQILYDLDFTSLESSGTGSLDWVLRVYDSLFTLNGNLGLTGSYRTRIRQSYGDAAEEGTDWDTLVLSDYRYSQLQVKNLLAMGFSPFPSDPRFRSTRLGYTVNWLLFKYSLDPSSTAANPLYEGLPPAWDKNTFLQHQAEAVLGWQPGLRLNSVSLTAQLPPLDSLLTLKAEAYLWLLKTSINSVFNEAADSWLFTLKETLQFTDRLYLSEEVQLDFMEADITKATTSLVWGDFSSSFIAQEITADNFQPASVSLSYKLPQKQFYFWKNRSKFEIGMNTTWNMNLYKNEANIIANNLTFTFNMKYSLYKFLDLSFSTNSYNYRTYQYFPGLTTTWVNPITDLLKSFNFFDTQDRKESAFKLKSITFEAVHHLHDWDLTLRYEGKPVIETVSGKPAYTWDDTFSILLQWIPIPELRSTLRGEDGELLLRG